jgi:hypothetical protein
MRWGIEGRKLEADDWLKWERQACQPRGEVENRTNVLSCKGPGMEIPPECCETSPMGETSDREIGGEVKYIYRMMPMIGVI